MSADYMSAAYVRQLAARFRAHGIDADSFKEPICRTLEAFADVLCSNQQDEREMVKVPREWLEQVVNKSQLEDILHRQEQK